MAENNQTPNNEQNTNRKNNNWVPWVLGILLAVALTALAFTAFKSDKPVVKITDQDGITSVNVQSPSVDMNFTSDQQAQQKTTYESRLNEERRRTENAETNLSEHQRTSAATTGKLSEKIGEVIEQQKQTNTELKGIRSDLNEVRGWQEVVNDNINTGFGNVNKGLASIDKNVVSVKEEIKKQHELTREEIKNVFKSIPRSLKDDKEDSGWPSGAKK
jgi:hypothetical protein